MPSVTSLLGLLCVVLTVNYVSAQQVGDPRVHLFFEYLRPYWRRHRARIRPFVFARVVPLWRVARSAESDAPDTQSVNCFYFNPAKVVACFKDMDMLECPAEKHFSNPLLANFLEFEVGEMKNATDSAHRFTLYPKKEASMKISAKALKRQGQNKLISIHHEELQSTDDGIKISDKACWQSMMNFIVRGGSRKEIDIERSTSKGRKIEKRVVVGKLFVSPF